MNFMYFLAILIGPLVKILYGFIGNYAVTLVVATLLLKLLLFPLSIHQQKSSAKMAVFQPLMNEIQQKYKNDPQKQQEELMKLQQEHGFNPMGGCLPMLLTMLVLFGFLGVVYYPVHYIFGVDNAAVKAACEAIGIATANTSTMQTALIQAIHNGAVIDPSIIPANIVAEIQNFNTGFFGMDMCDVPGFRFVPIAIFPAIAAVTMFISYFVTQLMMSSLIFLNNVKDGVDLSITITPDDTESRYFSKIVSKSELAGTGMSNAEYMQASVDQYIVLVKS